MKNHMNAIPVRAASVITAVKNVNALVAAVFAPPIPCYAKLPRLPDDDESKVVFGERR